jgi:hypothetical protein
LTNDKYPVLVAVSSIPAIWAQATHLKGYLADDTNEFDEEWLEEQQRRLEAVHSYIKSRQVQIELSHCQRWIELRIGEWLGPALAHSPGRGKSLPGKDINDRHKHEFRFLAANKAIFTAILEKYRDREIPRAELLASIEDAKLCTQGAKMGSSQKARGQYRCPCGETFYRPTWHCEVCNYHWPLGKEVCSQCHQGKRSERKPLHDLEGIDPGDFKLATSAMGEVHNFSEFTPSADPTRLLRGIKNHEKEKFLDDLLRSREWIDSVITLLRANHVLDERSD